MSESLLMDQVAAAAFMGISVTTFKRRRYDDKINFPRPVTGFTAKLFWKREDIRRYVDNLGYQDQDAQEQDDKTEPQAA